MSFRSNTFSILMFVSLMGVNFAADAAVRHPFQEKRALLKLREDSKNVPVYMGNDMPDQQFEIIKLIRSDGLFKKNYDEALAKLKMRAYELHADAIVDVTCEKVGRSVAASCYGHAIKWK